MYSCTFEPWYEQVPYADAANHRSSSEAYLDYSVEDQSVSVQFYTKQYP